MKIKGILATVITIALAGCGSSTMDTAEVEALLQQAKATMAAVESMSAEMTMEMDMSMGDEVIESTTVARIRSQQEPMKMAMDMESVMNDGTVLDQMQMYAVEEDGYLRTYMSMADVWYAETMEMNELRQYNAEENVDLYLDNITEVRSEGEEKINGTMTTKISGVIKGDAMEDALAGNGLTASADALGLTGERLDSIYDEWEGLPIDLWIDAEGYVMQYELNMTEMMQKIMDASMEAVGSELKEEDIILKIDKTVITMTCNDFNAVGEILIPEEALHTAEGEHTHLE